MSNLHSSQCHRLSHLSHVFDCLQIGINIPNRHIRTHIDFITPTVHFDTKVTPVENRPQIVKRKGAGVQWKPSHHMPPKTARPGIKHVTGDVSDCEDDITPDCLRALYGMPTLNPKTKLHVCIFSLCYNFHHSL